MATQLLRLKYSHEAMIDRMIANPAIAVRDLAAQFDVTEHWIYCIRSSNAFREKLAERTAEIVDPLLSARVEDSFDMVVHRSLGVLMEKLSKPEAEVPADLALQAAALGAKARGFGGFGAKVAVTVQARDPDWLAKSADRLRSLNQGVVDVTGIEVPDTGSAGAAG